MIGAIIAFVLGGLAAFADYRILKKAIDKDNKKAMFAYAYRQFVNIGFLALLYFLSPLTPWSRLWVLGGGAFGLVVTNLVFSFKLSREVKFNG